MDSSRLSVKFFFDAPADFDVTQFVPVFHSWIQTHAIKDHLLIDVADYAHVHNGPGIVLVAHEANYSLDCRGGRWGLTYQRKQPIPGTLGERIRIAHQACEAAAGLLSDKLNFQKNEIEFRICDRLAAPDNAETLNAVKAAVVKIWPQGQLDHRQNSAELFEISIRLK